MRYRKLGTTGLEVSEVGFGAWAIGGEDYGPTDDAESVAALERAYDLGVNFFDTSDMYGAGHSEILVGRALKGKNPPGIVATKVGFVGRRGSHRKDFSRAHVEQAVEQSLRRLGREAVDFYQLHNPTLSDLGDGELFGIMDGLVAAGKIRFWGVSIGTRDTVEIARRAMAWPSAAGIQIICNLLQRSTLESLREEIGERKIGVVARAPLEYGLLTGKFSPETRFPPSDQRSWRWTRGEFSRRLEQVERLREFSSGGRLSPAQVAIGFVLSYAEVSVVICGAKRPSQVEENAATAVLRSGAMTEGELRKLRVLISS